MNSVTNNNTNLATVAPFPRTPAYPTPYGGPMYLFRLSISLCLITILSVSLAFDVGGSIQSKGVIPSLLLPPKASNITLHTFSSAPRGIPNPLCCA